MASYREGYLLPNRSFNGNATLSTWKRTMHGTVLFLPQRPKKVLKLKSRGFVCLLFCLTNIPEIATITLVEMLSPDFQCGQNVFFSAT